MKPRKSASRKARKSVSKSTSRKLRKSVSKKSSRKSSRKSRKSVSKKSSRKSVSKKSSRKSRKSVSKKSSRKSRKSVLKKSSRKSRKSVSKKSSKKVVTPPKNFVVPVEILQKLDQSGYRLGEILGEGVYSIVYEVYKKGEENKKDQDNRYVIKITKEKIPALGQEKIPLYKLGELIEHFDTPNPAFIIKYCGESLLSKWRREPNFMPLKDALISLLENIREIHKKGWVHNDIKPDNICVQQKKDGTYRLKLMDFGLAKVINNEDRPFGDAILSKNKKKKEYASIRSVNDFKQKNAPLDILSISSFFGNIYWSLHSTLIKQSFNTYDDVEAVALSMWGLYGGLPWSKYYDEYVNKKIPNDVRYEIIKQRLDENLCPFEIIREVLREAWNGSQMDLDGLIKRLKENY